jgi:hypothetical protein
MEQYHQYNELYTDNTDLDKMARDVNNSKKKLKKQIFQNINDQALNTCVGIDCLMDPSNARFAPSNLGANLNNGDFESGLPTPMQQSICKLAKLAKPTKIVNNSFNYYNDDSSRESNISSQDSVFTTDSLSESKGIKYNNKYSKKSTNAKRKEPIMDFSYVSRGSDNFSDVGNRGFKNYDSFNGSDSFNISDISSNYSSLPQTLKKKIRMGSNHLKSYKEGDEKNELSHIIKCSQCKNDLADLLKSVVAKNQVSLQPNLPIQSNLPTQSSMFGINMFELKDLLILLLIGIFIIVFVDIFLRR